MYATSNRLKREFHNCEYMVKKTLFTSYCSNLYGAHLWSQYNKASLNSVKVAYNNSCRILLGYDRFCSASTMFVENTLLNFSALLRKNIHSFMLRITYTRNAVIKMLGEITCGGHSTLGRHWYRELTGMYSERWGREGGG